MSFFKQNSRFGVLAEEVSINKETNNKNNNNKNNKNDNNKNNNNKNDNNKNNNKNDNNKNNNNKNDNNKNNNNKNKINEEICKIEETANKCQGNSFKKTHDDRPHRDSLTNRETDKEKLESERSDKALCIDKFPTLCKNIEDINSKNIEDINKTSFLAKLNSSIEDDNIQLELKQKELKPGWVSITREPLTGKTIIEHGESLYKTHVKSEKEVDIDVLNALCDLYEKRTTEYIELYCYDNWEKTFKTPNWEEEELYNEQMHEEYEELLDEEINDDDKTEFITDPDRFVKYWEHY
jgi:hypothetical protein